MLTSTWGMKNTAQKEILVGPQEFKLLPAEEIGNLSYMDTDPPMNLFGMIILSRNDLFCTGNKKVAKELLS